MTDTNLTLSDTQSHALPHTATQSNIPTAQLNSHPTHTAKARQAIACHAWAVFSLLTSHALQRSIPRTPTLSPTHSHAPSHALRLTVPHSPTHHPTHSDTQSHTLPRTITRTPTHSPTHSHSPSHALRRTVPRTPTHRRGGTPALYARRAFARPHGYAMWRSAPAEKLPPSHSSLITKQSCSRRIIAATQNAASIARPTHKSRDARFAAATLVAHRTSQITSHAHRQGNAGSRLQCLGGFSSAHVPRTPTHGYAVQYPHHTAQLTSHTHFSAHVHHTIHAFSYELFAHH